MERRYHSPVDYLTAAKTTNSKDELEFLATSEFDFVRLAVAKNPHVTSSILRTLVPNTFDTWNEQEIAGVLGENPKTPYDALERIAVGIRPYLDLGRGNIMAVEAAIKFCNNPATPLSVIKLIANSHETSIKVRRKIANQASRKDVLELLLTDPSEAVRSRAAKSLERHK